jgi:8-oxo-dGTP pyrophosphatase MutT (NUDIX family)
MDPRFITQALRPAAVLIAIVLRTEPTVLFTRRTEHLASHAGQISFAGGRAEAADASPIATALREAHEEIGLLPGSVDVIGQFPTYTTGTAYEITPVVGFVAPSFTPQPDAGEVAEVFEVPLAFLMNPSNHQRHEFDASLLPGAAALSLPSGRRSYYSMPYEQSDQRYFIWGATASMLRNFYAFLRAE